MSQWWWLKPKNWIFEYSKIPGNHRQGWSETLQTLNPKLANSFRLPFASKTFRRKAKIFEILKIWDGRLPLEATQRCLRAQIKRFDAKRFWRISIADASQKALELFGLIFERHHTKDAKHFAIRGCETLNAFLYIKNNKHQESGFQTGQIRI